jgi:hypothetical protein
MVGASAACGVLLAGSVVGTAVAAAPLRPDLVESTLSFAQHGRSLTVSDVVRNRGQATARSSRSGYFVAGALIAKRVVGALRPGDRSRATRTIAIPASVRPGKQRLVVCADARASVRESNERNNCLVAARRVVVGDVMSPKFDGLARATTCIPGPVGGPIRNSSYVLTWKAATDDATPSSAIIYEIFEVHESGTEDYAHPAYVTAPGATTFVTPALPDNVPHYFVVRARDEAGNRDHNAVERLGVNLCV